MVANALSVAEIRDVIELSTAHGLHVQVCPGFRGLATRRVRHVPVSGEAFLYVEPGGRATWQLAAKRAIDVIGAGLGVLIAAPILLLAWIAIRIEDNGPALYRQTRIGLHRQPFVVYKMRSMTLDAESSVEDLSVINERTDGPLFKAAVDPRVTRVGAVLRALSVDEIPQLFNVLTGKMSLVGPRPALPDEVAQFDPELLRRHDIKPGVTGLWQLEARDSPSFHAYRQARPPLPRQLVDRARPDDSRCHGSDGDHARSEVPPLALNGAGAVFRRHCFLEKSAWILKSGDDESQDFGDYGCDTTGWLRWRRLLAVSGGFGLCP